jgi:hypothetical protein
MYVKPVPRSISVQFLRSAPRGHMCCAFISMVQLIHVRFSTSRTGDGGVNTLCVVWCLNVGLCN